MTEAEVADPFQLCGVTIEGKYRVASVVGDGGFGVVYRGVHKGFGELIAIKCLKLPGALDEKQRDDLLDQLKEEGRLLHRLSKATSGIVQALDVGAFTTPAGVWVPYLVLEWLEGQTLGEFMRDRIDRGEGGLPLREAIRLLEPAARALAVAHAQKIAHRDVKPANLFVTEAFGARTVKVLDFGIAKVLVDHPSFTAALAATAKGPSAFTPRYGAPEQFNKQRGGSGPWTDVFALALILVEVVTGKKALDGDDPTQLYIASADPTLRPTLRSRGARSSDAVERVLVRALSIEPKHRYPEAGEFWNALVAAAAQPETEDTEHGLGPGSAPGAESASLLTTAEFEASRQGPRRGATASHVTKPDGGSPTVPVESLRSPGVAAPLGPARTALSAVGSLASQPAAAPGSRPDDPMAETPMIARAARGASDRPDAPREPGSPAAAAERGGAPARAGAASPSDRAPGTPAGRGGAPTDAATPARSPWPWIAAVVLFGGVAFAYTTWWSTGTSGPKPAATAGMKPGPRALPPTVDAGPTATATASVVSSASAAPSAIEVPLDTPPPAPPADMVLVAPATIEMGAASDTRKVTVTRPFYIDRFEVPVRAYQECMAKRICSPADHVAVMPEQPRIPGVDAGLSPVDEFSETWTRRCNEPRKELDHPINCVDFASAEGFCRWRGRRLPTEAEWELAARGVTGRKYAWGDAPPSCGRSCYDKNSGCLHRGELVQTCPGGVHPDKTAEGVYDLGGNVSEWVADGFVSPPPGGVDPRGDPDAPLRVVRGASFLDDDERLGATWRNAAAPVTAHVTIGFRCAMDVPTTANGTTDAGAP